MGGGSPRFRRDLQASSVEAEGVVFIEVTDAQSGKSFRFYDFEHTVALALDGRPLEQVAIDLRNTAELELTPEQLAAFADQLQALGFLEGEDSGVVEHVPGAGPDGDADSVFPPLTAEESGQFERPRSLTEGGATAEILGLAEADNDGEQITPGAQPPRAPEPKTPEPDRIAAQESEPTAGPPGSRTPPQAPYPPAAPRSAPPPSPGPFPPSPSSSGPAPTAGPPKSKTPPLVFAAPGAPNPPFPGPSTGAGASAFSTSGTGAGAPVFSAPSTASGTAPFSSPSTGAGSASPFSSPSTGAGSPFSSPSTGAGSASPFSSPPSASGSPGARSGAPLSSPPPASPFSSSPTASGSPAFSASAPAARASISSGTAGATPPQLPSLSGATPVSVPSAPLPPLSPPPRPTPSLGFTAQPSPSGAPASPPVPPLPTFRTANGSYTSGELESSLPVSVGAPPGPDSPRSWRPLSERGSASPGPAVEPAHSTLETRREPLRLVPPPLEAAHPHAADLATQPLPALTERHGSPAVQTDGSEVLDPPIMNTGDPTFPPPVPVDPNAPVQRLELSMTRRFITPERANPKVIARRAWMAYGALGLGAALIVFIMVYRYFAASSEPPPVSVRVVVPSPTSIYRWWDAGARVQQTGGAPLNIPRDGKIAEIVPDGTRFAAGDVLVMLESAKPFRGAINHNKSRLAYYEQMRETMTQQDNRARLRDAELKIAEKKRLITEAQEQFANHALVAAQPGEVAAALVSRGATVKSGEPVLRLKSSGFRATFELPRADADKARQLGFCRVEVEGKPLDCSLAAEGGDETHVAIELPNDPGLVDKSVRLARDRLDAVFLVPLSALVRVGESDRLYVVGASGRAEMRVVAVADRGPSGATVTQGLDVGDRVIVDVPAGLRADSRVLIASTTAR
jgi:hypothetical protein